MDLFVSKLKRTKLPRHSLEGQVLFCFAWQTIRAGNAKRNNQEKKLPLDSFKGLSAVYIMVANFRSFMHVTLKTDPRTLGAGSRYPVVTRLITFDKRTTSNH